MRQVLVVVALAVFVVLVGGGSAFAGTPQQAAWTPADCQACHDKAVTPAFEKSHHAKLGESCAQCHPNVAEHVKAQSSGGKGPVPTLKNLKANDISAVCLKCHETGRQANFQMSKHARLNVACTQCHSVHNPKSLKGQLKTVRDTDLCFTCHKDKRAQSLRTSHHPVREGKLECSSCHNPHDGNTPKMINADSVNELCYQCHAEKRGPFAFEHAPVREDCVSCHEPHGTNHPRLVKQKLPNLCWNCHFTSSGHFGNTFDNLNTEKGAAVAPPGTTAYPTRGSRFVERSCRNCHFKLHGSNHPSGAYFLR
jgi:DmsE family decaheme c-type cytochrome